MLKVLFSDNPGCDAIYLFSGGLIQKSVDLVVCDFLDGELPLLSTTYQWRIPKIEGFSGSGKSGYHENVALKRYLQERWSKASYEEKIQLARVIVSDWGGVKANRPATLQAYVDGLLSLAPRSPLKGIASYSKIFSIADPLQYAIYDARVAACLNAVQLNAGMEHGLAFNYVPGRNNVVGNSAKKSGFTQQPEFSVKSLVARGWESIKRDETYAKYNELLSRCAGVLKHWERFEIEMVLFARAEHECQRAMDAAVP